MGHSARPVQIGPSLCRSHGPRIIAGQQPGQLEAGVEPFGGCTALVPVTKNR